MISSCAKYGVTGMSATEVRDLKDAIYQAAFLANMYASAILALILQETGGCVRVPKTSDGLLEGVLRTRVEGGGYNCDRDTLFEGQDCSYDNMKHMVYRGLFEPDVGFRIAVEKGAALHPHDDYEVRYYWGVRIRKSQGNFHRALPMEKYPEGNPCYVSDFANRMVGWVGSESPCKF